jgi:hypothetical protein
MPTTLERVRELPETSERRSHGQPTFVIRAMKSFVMCLAGAIEDAYLTVAPRQLIEAADLDRREGA